MRIVAAHMRITTFWGRSLQEDDLQRCMTRKAPAAVRTVLLAASGRLAQFDVRCHRSGGFGDLLAEASHLALVFVQHDTGGGGKI